MNFIKKLFTSDDTPPLEDLTNNDVDVAEDFAILELPQELNNAIAKLGFTNCTPVQKEVLPHSLDGKDVIAQAQTGTGKTAAFLISIIAYDLENPSLDERPAGTPYALIIAPTRELVLQISSDAVGLAEDTDIKILAVVGGIDYEKQKRELLKPVDIIVATPGRLLDFCRSNVINLSQVESLVIDEADRMLSMGFIPDVKAIIQRTPKKNSRQTQLFSATFSEDIKRLASSWTLDPVRIEIEPEKLAVDSVTQIIYLTSEEDKFKVLYNLIKVNKITRVIVFVNRRDESRRLEDMLYRHGFNTGLLTGEVHQKKRIKTLDDFKSGKIEVLVATDVAGRGIHVDDISHVVNYNLPEDPEDYVHRIGRTGRAGSDGTSVSLACETESFMLPAIETLLGSKMNCEQPPEDLLVDTPAPIKKSRQKSSDFNTSRDKRQSGRRPNNRRPHR
ncbi:MAG: DEAD/DEAH box helicase [Pseudomonadales bacterium]|jgi:ATP-dependent RNA helicase RhlB